MHTIVNKTHKIPFSFSLRQSGPIQILLSITVVAVLVALAAQSYDIPKVKARMAEALIFAGVLKQEITSYYAETGRWPMKKDIVYLFDSSNFSNKNIEFDVRNGSFEITFDTKDKRLGSQKLAFNRVEVKGADSATILWNCGENTFPENVIYNQEFKGSLVKKYMPSICKVK